ncbi:MAG: hypothetical protein ACJAT2_003230 [Bacteriovoracaceae bacterium]|jgi:hypothetical protein
MKGYRNIPFKKLSLGLIQLSLLASTFAVGVKSTAFGKNLTSNSNNTCQNSCSLKEMDSPCHLDEVSQPRLKKEDLGPLKVVLIGFCSLSFKGHLSLYSGVSPPFV